MKKIIALLVLTIPASAQTLCPDGTYVGGKCSLAPDGSYVGTEGKRFDSAGAGFARGFAKGRQIRSEPEAENFRPACEAEELPQLIREIRELPKIEEGLSEADIAELESSTTEALVSGYQSRVEMCVLSKTLSDEEFLEVLEGAFPQ